MIPNVIHYCWFGRNPKPEIVQKCIASWHVHCPGWEIREWNEDNFDISQIPFMQEAYKKGKWAFVSDVARLTVLYNYGGIYLDTDVEILLDDPFDAFLSYNNVLPFENERNVKTGQMYGCEAKSGLAGQLLADYADLHFGEDTKVNTAINKPTFTKLFPELKWNGKTQIIQNTYFMGCFEYGGLMKHYGMRTWLDYLPEYKVHSAGKIRSALRNPQIFDFLEKTKLGRMISKPYQFIVYDLFDMGPIYFIKRKMLKVYARMRKNR